MKFSMLLFYDLNEDLKRSVVSIICWGDLTGRLFYYFSYLCESLTPAKETDRND